MNILRVIASMNPSTGGPCQGIRNSIPELVRHNIHNEVLSLDDPSASYIGQDPFPIHALGPASGPWCYSKKLLPWLKENLSRFDAVIIHGLWLYPSYATTKAFKNYSKELKTKVGNRTKLFVMPHGMLDPYFQKAPDRKLKALRNWLYWKIIERQVIEACDKIMFTTQTELLLARQTFTPYKPKSEVNIGYGIQNPPLSTAATKRSMNECFPQLAGNRYLLFLSRLHEKKGVDMLIEAYIDIIQHVEGGTNQKINSIDQLPLLVVAGPGLESPFGKALVEKVTQSGLVSSKIIFIGMVSGQLKWEVFHGCEAFVLPSHQENFGIAVAEALACGKPVLISNQVNIWQDVENSAAGLVAPDTSEGVKYLLLRWLNLSMDEKAQFANRAQNCYRANFTIHSAVNNLVVAVRSV